MYLFILITNQQQFVDQLWSLDYTLRSYDAGTNFSFFIQVRKLKCKGTRQLTTNT